MKLIPLLSFIALLAAPGIASQPGAEPRSDILRLPPAQAAEALLRTVAPRFVEMRVHDNGSYLAFISFATAPESTGLTGLCQAKSLEIALAPSDSPASRPNVADYSLTTVYKIVGNVDGGTVEPEEATQAGACANSGPVLAPAWGDNRGARFFTYHGTGVEFWLPVAALQEAIRLARSGRYGRIECERRELNDCTDPQAELGALEIRNLRRIVVTTTDAFDILPVNFQVTASFIGEASEGHLGGRQVTFEFNGIPLPGTRTGPGSFGFGRTRLFR